MGDSSIRIPRKVINGGSHLCAPPRRISVRREKPSPKVTFVFHLKNGEYDEQR
jgi:hypothetical protein